MGRSALSSGNAPGLWDFWHSSLVKNITDNKIWKSIPGGGGKLSGGEGKRRGWLRRGLVFVAERVLGVESGSGFQPQPCQHFRPLLVGFTSRCCSPPCNRRDGVRPQNRSWRHTAHPPLARTVPTLQHMEPANTTPSPGAG